MYFMSLSSIRSVGCQYGRDPDSTGNSAVNEGNRLFQTGQGLCWVGMCCGKSIQTLYINMCMYQSRSLYLLSEERHLIECIYKYHKQAFYRTS